MFVSVCTPSPRPAQPVIEHTKKRARVRVFGAFRGSPQGQTETDISRRGSATRICWGVIAGDTPRPLVTSYLVYGTYARLRRGYYVDRKGIWWFMSGKLGCRPHFSKSPNLIRICADDPETSIQTWRQPFSWATFDGCSERWKRAPEESCSEQGWARVRITLKFPLWSTAVMTPSR